MKNKLKFLALILVLPVAFVFTACGQLDSDAKVDVGNDSKYVEVTDTTELEGLVSPNEQEGEEEAAATTFTGAKITVNIDAGKYAKGKVNVVFTQTEDAQQNTVLQAAAKVNVEVDYDGVKGKVVTEAYLKDDVLYVNVAQNTVGQGDASGMGAMAQTVTGKIKFDLATYGDMFEYLLGNVTNEIAGDLPVDPSSLLEGEFDVSMVLGLVQQLNMKVYSYTEGDYVRFKLTTTDEETGDTVTAYLVFKAGVLAGVKVDAKMTSEGEEMKLSVAMEAFAGQVDFPSFDDYQDFQMPAAMM